MRIVKEYKTEIDGRPLVLQFTNLAERANAAVIGKYGETVVLVTVVMGKQDRAIDFFPLTVDYEEKFYAAGKILGSRFVRREGRPSEEAVLSGRLIDRAIRPLFDSRMRRDVQVTATVLAYDEEHDPDAVALITASTALMVSDIPWNGPVAGLKIAQINGEMVTNPAVSRVRSGNTFETFVAGTEGKINMIELEGLDAKESDVLTAFAMAQKEIDQVTALQKKIVEEMGRPKTEVYLAEPDTALRHMVKTYLDQKLEEAIYTLDKSIRESKINLLKHELAGHLMEQGRDEKEILAAGDLFEEEINDILHDKILTSEKRPDGRKLDELRELSSTVKLFERTHGSGLFTRGNTQSLALTTLASPDAGLLIETMETSDKKRFILHYNFPKWSVGETGPNRGPGRREIGHGALAEKSLRRVVPDPEEFPYAIRVVSEILSSNGSSSMATVCASSLSLMDAGVPIKKPVAGIAMGLITGPDGKFKVLTDIQGPEDHHGDMDFKIAGTKDGVNGIQLDVKIDGLTVPMIQATLTQAKAARLAILENMLGALATHRKELSKYAPIIRTLTIDPERIGLVIGSGGKMINAIMKKTGAVAIDIEDDGKIFITAESPEKAQAAVSEIELILKEYRPGDIIEGNVIKLLDFGAIVDLGGGQDGMIHVSELKNGFVKKVSDVVKVGDFVRAKVINAQEGKIGLSIKQL